MNDFYNDTGWPAQGAPGDSSSARSEFALIQAAFDKMPLLTASRLVRVNAGATGLESVTAATADLATVTLIEGVTEKAVLVDADELQMLDSASTPAFGMVKATLLKLVVYLKAAGGTWVHNVTGNVSGSSGSCTGNAATSSACSGNSATVTTNANLTGGVTSVGNAATVVTNANLTGNVTSVGNATTIAALPAISGAALTALTAANIAAGTAGISISGNAATVTSVTGATGNIAGSAGLNFLNDAGVGAVGTIAYCSSGATTVAAGATIAGSGLVIMSAINENGSGGLSGPGALYTGTGTWRNVSGSISQQGATPVWYLFQRIS